MARPLRIEYPDALYHLTSRGDGREYIFSDDADRLAFLSVLAGVVERFEWRLYAYCLMDNHYHLIAGTPKANLSKGMRQLNGVYTQRFNRRHGRVGHVFQGRFKAIVVDKQAYLLELSRYVVLNPVRAKMVRNPARYRWSSYRASAGLEDLPAFLDAAALLAYFAESLPAARRRYVAFVEEGIRTPSPWEKLQGQVLLGEQAFLRKLAPRLKSKALAKEIPKAQRHAARPSLKQAFGRVKPEQRAARNRLIAALHLKHGYTQAQIAEHLGLHYATVSRIVKRQIDARNKT
jgi:REP element-mobilizing transposase RayT